MDDRRMADDVRHGRRSWSVLPPPVSCCGEGGQVAGALQGWSRGRVNGYELGALMGAYFLDGSRDPDSIRSSSPLLAPLHCFRTSDRVHETQRNPPFGGFFCVSTSDSVRYAIWRGSLDIAGFDMGFAGGG